MNYDQWKQQNPQDEEKENKCAYCGEPCDNYFCDKECKKAYEND